MNKTHDAGTPEFDNLLKQIGVQGSVPAPTRQEMRLASAHCNAMFPNLARFLAMLSKCKDMTIRFRKGRRGLVFEDVVEINYRPDGIE